MLTVQLVEILPAAEGSSGFEVKHVASVPALAYVAAGKMQRKFLLSGWGSGGEPQRGGCSAGRGPAI